MTHFSPDPLSKGTEQYLRQLQQAVLTNTDRAEQYRTAQDLWKNRKNRQADQRRWTEIERALAGNHPIPDMCQYCEFDRCAATEHFFPKKHFPDKAFKGSNYLLICYRCNSVYKGQQFAVFDPPGSSTVFPLPDTKGAYPVPPSEDAVLINPQTDNPADYLLIDLDTGAFLPLPGIDARGFARAVYTYTLLHLNTDANLLRYRKKFIGTYLEKLKDYVAVKQATTFADLLRALPIAKRAIVVQNRPFAEEQARLLQVLRDDLLDDLFPSVWQEIKKQKGWFPTVAALFTAAPEAEAW